MVIDCFQLSKRKGLLKKISKLKVGPKKFARVCENRPCERKKSPILACLLYHNLITIYTSYYNKIFVTTAEFNGLSSAAYGNGIVHSERKILAKI